MVSVKVNGKWVKLKPGETVNKVTVKSPASFYESPKVKPGQPVYVNIDDIKKSSGTIYTSPSTNQYVDAGTLSSGGITPTKKSSSSQPKTAEQISTLNKTITPQPTQQPPKVNTNLTPLNLQDYAQQEKQRTQIEAVTRAISPVTSGQAALGIKTDYTLGGLFGSSQSPSLYYEKSIETKAPRTKYTEQSPSLSDITELERMGAISPTEAKDYIRAVAPSIERKAYEKEFYTGLESLRTKKESEITSKNYQGRIDKGEDYSSIISEQKADISKANKELSDYQASFNKKWNSDVGMGPIFRKNVGLTVQASDIYYGDKEAKSKVLKQFGIGAGVGAGITGGSLLLSPSVLAAVNPVALTIGGVAATYSYGKSGVRGYQTYKQAMAMGASEKDSLTRGVASFGTELTPFAAYSSGGLAGSFAVTGGYNFYKTGTARGYTSKDFENIRKGLSKEGAIKLQVKEGYVKQDLMTKDLQSIRKYGVSVNKNVLTAAEAKSIGKINLRGEVIQSFSSTGKVGTGVEISNLKYGGIGGEKLQSFATIKGAYKGGSFKGIKFNIEQIPKAPKFFQVGKTLPKYQEVSMEGIMSKGNVKFSPEKFFRAETGKSISVDIGRSGWFKGLGWKALPKTSATGKSAIASEYKGGELIGSIGKGGFSSKISSIYKDMFGAIGSNKFAQMKPFTFSKTPSTGSYKMLSGSGSNVQSQISLQKGMFAPAPIVRTSNIQIQSSSQPITTTFSSYAGKGTYEQTMGGRTPQSFFKPQSLKFSPLISTGTTTDIIQDIAQKGKTGSKTSSAFAQEFKQINLQIPKTNTKLDFKPLQKQKQGLVPYSKSLNVSSLGTGIGGFGGGPPFGGGFPPLPSFSMFDYEKKSRSKPKTFRGNYAPTISAIAFNIKAPKISQAYSKGFGALVQRAVISKSRRKKSGTTKRKKSRTNS